VFTLYVVAHRPRGPLGHIQLEFRRLKWDLTGAEANHRHGLSWSLIGLCFAVAYSVLVTITYSTQLTVVRSNVGALAEGALRLIEFSPGS
jgi:hypothetical protein